jgi:hypothetical protein
MESSLALPVATCTPDECGNSNLLERSLPVTLPSKAAMVRTLLPTGTVLTILQVNPVASALQANLQRYLPRHAADLIGIASRWSEFQRIARTMIVAAGFRPESLLVRDGTRPGWKRGLESTSAVICDIVTAQQLPKKCFPVVFRLLNESSIAQLRAVECEAAEKRAFPHPAL